MATSKIRCTWWRKVGGPYTPAEIGKNYSEDIYFDTANITEVAIVSNCGTSVFPAIGTITQTNIRMYFSGNYKGDILVAFTVFSDHLHIEYRLHEIGSGDTISDRGKIIAVYVR